MRGLFVEPNRCGIARISDRNEFSTSMAADQNNKADNEADDITSDEILAFVLGDAEPRTARRVGAAALALVSVRERLAQAQKIVDNAARDEAYAPTHVREESADFARRAARLRERMMEAVLSAAPGELNHEASPDYDGAPPASDAVAALTQLAQRGGILYRAGVSAAREWTQALGGAARSQTLVTGRHPLTLPCLAPATASAAGSVAHVQRQTLTTGDGVRIEFQQLPSVSPPRLRVFVDASGLSGDAANRAYNVAYLTVEEGAGSAASAPPLSTDPASAPDRHIFVVALNHEGRGFTEVVVGGTLSVGATLPAPRGACHLIGATLARWSPEFGEAAQAGGDAQGGNDNKASSLASDG